jgi:hypothetical protein
VFIVQTLILTSIWTQTNAKIADNQHMIVLLRIVKFYKVTPNLQ